ncbi:MAG TPA: sigma-54 dependent transcriptional regulator, partial [Candidatus Methylomirabilis sp.]|nr:sigma-54 dependent transcriptional regulator [Candidatus Methylomirabilis sp.]
MTKHERILIVDDEEQMRDLLVKVLEKNGFQVAVCGGGGEALAFLEKEPMDLVVTDVRMPGMGGMEALRAIKELNPEIVVIIMTAFGSIDQAVQAVKDGAYDYINKPFKIDEMLLTIEKALEERRLRHEVTTLRQELRTRYRFENLIGKSRAMQDVFSLIEQVAGSRSTVMIYGKSGTGKELVAKAVHYNSPRVSKAFVAVNCAAIPSELLESELFGHEKGSFTGAVATKVGKFELATGGSLFLDEVGSMRLDLQAKILRALQEREIERVGGTR